MPEDISVVGYDDIYFSKYLSPPLTTMHIKKYEMGETSAKELINIIHNEDKKQTIMLKPDLIIRQST